MAAYTIKKGDTLSAIAKANNTTVDAIAAANGIKNVNRIQAGASLNIPGSAATATENTGGAAGAAPAAAASASRTVMPQTQAYVDQMLETLRTSPYDTSGYNSIGSDYSARMNSIRDQYQQMADQQTAAARAEAEQNRRQAYVNGRLSANRNNEQIAALGLAGNLYRDPMSGYSETSRIAADNNMRTNINNVTLAEQNAINEIALTLMNNNAQLSMQEAQQLASIQLQAQQAAQSAYESNIASQLSAIGLLGNVEQSEYQAARDAIEDERWEREFALAQQRASGGGGSGSRRTDPIEVPLPYYSDEEFGLGAIPVTTKPAGNLDVRTARSESALKGVNTAFLR